MQIDWREIQQEMDRLKSDSCPKKFYEEQMCCHWVTCQTCGGTGKARRLDMNKDIRSVGMVKCHRCHGHGAIDTKRPQGEE